jgi:hypothetical protein
MSALAQIVIALLNLAAIAVNWAYERWKRMHRYGVKKAEGIQRICAWLDSQPDLNDSIKWLIIYGCITSSYMVAFVLWAIFG